MIQILNSFYDQPNHLPTTDARDNLNSDAWEKEKLDFLSRLRKLAYLVIRVLLKSFYATQSRSQHAKFTFSRNLSDALENLVAFGACYGLSREDIAETTINEILALSNYSHDAKQIKDIYKLKIKKQKRKRLLASRIQLPNLITKEMDLDFFIVGSEVPNFIGSVSVISECVAISDRESMGLDTENKVVLIPQADPGYDWFLVKVLPV